MPRKNYNKRDMKNNMYGEHSNGRRNPNPEPPQSAKQVEKEDKINIPPVHNK
jgi:hypothetical protein